MGRRKRAVHPWSAQDRSLAECTKRLGEGAAREAIGCFMTVQQDSSGYGPNSDQFIAWVADLLSGVERKFDVRITGGLATLLWVSSGARPLTSEDRFERSRKSWDEALRRARKREFYGGPGLFDSPVARFHQSRLRFEHRHRARWTPSLASFRQRLELRSSNPSAAMPSGSPCAN